MTENRPAKQRRTWGFWILQMILLFSWLPLSAQSSLEDRAKELARTFLDQRYGDAGAKGTEYTLMPVYSSPAGVRTPVFVFQSSAGGFAVVAVNHDAYRVVAYSDVQGEFAGELSPGVRSLLHHYEDSPDLCYHMVKPTEASKGEVVSPLLYKYNISLDQYHHAEVGNSWTGCVATALTQILLYHAAEKGTTVRGYGSHCYYYEPYGNICADFSNADYSDPELLSYHVAIAMDMQFTPDPPGSSPSPDADLRERIAEYFHFFARNGLTDDFYLREELDNGRPLYAGLPGDPVSHAVVIDGYDDQGYFHLNFGWGGSYNGYYLLNNNGSMGMPSGTFSSNLSVAVVLSPEAIAVSTQDSLALVALYHALGGYQATGWDLTKTVWSWPGVTVMNGRVIGLRLQVEIPPATEQSLPDALGDLTELRELDLTGCFNGTLPSTLTNLTHLKHLVIRHGAVYVNGIQYKGNFHAAIPADIDQLTALEWLELQNGVEGTIPATIGNLPALKYLFLNRDTLVYGRGGLSGQLPEELGNLSSLQQLFITGQQLSGPLPSSLNNLRELTVLNLSGNLLDGPVPALELPKVLSVDLNGNRFTGFEDAVWDAPLLTKLALQRNAIAGALPAGLCTLSSLHLLDISDNRITSLPEEIGHLLALERFYADRNLLERLPEGVALFPVLKELTASGNRISDIPVSLGQSEQLEKIDLSHNRITFIPPAIGELANLKELILNDNRIDSIPATLTGLPQNITVLLQNNDIRGPVPEALMTAADGANKFVRLDSNRLVFSDIPVANNLAFGFQKQREIPLTKKVFKVRIGDTVTIDIRDISPLSHPGNEYYWFVYPEFRENSAPEKKMEDVGNDPVLKLVINETNIGNRYYCKVFNSSAPLYTTTYNNYIYTFPVLEFVNTDTIVFERVTEDDVIAGRYPGMHVTSLSGLADGTVSDGTVTLVPPLDIYRGEVFWEASSDGTEWVKVSEEMERADLKANVQRVGVRELVLKPRTTAYYRCCLYETGCDTMYSEKLKVKAYGEVLYDEVIHVTDSAKVIRLDSIEVHVPRNFHNSDFRLTVTRIFDPPAAPDTMTLYTAYDVTVSFADTFAIPLLIKLKNIDKSKVTEKNIDSFQAVYYDERERKWKVFDDMHLSMADTSLVLLTHHLTKVSGWSRQNFLWGYTDVYERNNIRVFYKDAEEAYMKVLYGKHQTPQSWHVSGVPLLVQDITEYLPKVIAKYKALGLDTPDGTFDVYVKRMIEDLGCVGLLGMLNGYMLINAEIETPTRLKQVLAHEFMHYTQDYYITASAGNAFWMEAHATLADRVVWDSTDVPLCEAERNLLHGRAAKNSIFNFLADSWDAWDCNAIYTNLLGEIDYYYLAGTFLHYMRSYRPGSKKLEPATLLKETSWTGTWRSYLTWFVKEHLQADLGTEYEDYVKLIISGKEKNFTILNEKGDPFFYIRHSTNLGKFTTYIQYSFKEGQSQAEDKVSVEVPYLAAKVILLKNLHCDTMLLVNYHRQPDNDTTHRVYYVDYDMNTRTMQLLNITDSTNFSFLLEARNVDNILKRFRHIGMILLINKDNANSSDFTAEIDLTATPVLNIEDVGMLSIYRGDSPVQHDFDNTQDYIPIGTENTSYWQKMTGFSTRLIDRSVTRTLVNDHTLRTVTKFTMVIAQPVVTGEPTMTDSTVYEQTIVQDLLAGTLTITEHKTRYWKMNTFRDYVLDANGELTGTKVVYYAYLARKKEEEKTYVLKDYMQYLLPDKEAEPFYSAFGWNIKVFKTGNTYETKNVIQSIDAHYTETTYNEDGSVSGTKVSHYTGTDYSPTDLYLYFIVRTDEP